MAPTTAHGDEETKEEERISVNVMVVEEDTTLVVSIVTELARTLMIIETV